MDETDRTRPDRQKANRKGGKPGEQTESAGVDAIALLTDDHRAVEALFDRFEDEDDPDERAAVAAQICRMLRIHTEIEETFFYPAARTTAEDSLLDEAQVEHDSAKALIEKIERLTPAEPAFAATVKVLGEYVKHHVREEEDELFEQVRDGDLDLDEIGAQMSARKKALEEAVAPS